MVYIVDGIMGSGKSSAAIHHINNSDCLWLYCTPYLTEVERMRQECAAKSFVAPSDERGSKYRHLQSLMTRRENVVITHALFDRLGDDVLEIVRNEGYSLVLDETTAVIKTTNYRREDFTSAMALDLIMEKDGHLMWNDPAYSGTVYAEMERAIENYHVLMSESGNHTFLVYPPDAFMAFRDVYVLTYLFEGSLMQNYLDMFGIEYERLGVHPEGDHYQFFSGNTVVPDYIHDIKDKIHLCDEEALNEIGTDNYALSLKWYQRHRRDGKLHRLKNNHRTFNRRCIPSDFHRIMWCTFKDFEDSIKQPGTKHGFVPIGTRATNSYADKTDLAYLVNCFINPNLILGLKQFDVSVDEENYALSSLVQWVWRSAIRNGEDINLYIPSKRMRNLFTGWIDSITA